MVNTVLPPVELSTMVTWVPLVIACMVTVLTPVLMVALVGRVLDPTPNAWFTNLLAKAVNTNWFNCWANSCPLVGIDEAELEVVEVVVLALGAVKPFWADASESKTPP